MTSYGIDKPDLRAPDLKIINLGEFNAFSHLNKKFPVFEVIILRNAFSNMEEYKERWSFLTNNSNYNYRVPIVLPIENDEQANSNWFENFHAIATFENPHLITKFLKLKKVTLYAVVRESQTIPFSRILLPGKIETVGATK